MKKFFGRFLAVIGALALLPILLLVVGSFFFSKVDKEVNINPKTVLVVDLSKEYPEEPPRGVMSFIHRVGGTSFYELISSVEEAATDNRIKGIVLLVSEVEMGLAQLEELRNAIKEFKSKGKFVLAYASSFGDLTPGTKKLYIASSADEVWMQPFSTVNITGLHVNQPFFGAVLKDWGVKPQITTRKQYKNAYASLTDERASAANIEATTNLMQKLYGKIISSMASDLKIDDGVIQKITLENPMMSDQEAKAAKVIHRIGYIDQVRESALARAGSLATSWNPTEHNAILSIDEYFRAIRRDDNSSKKSLKKIAIIYGVGMVMQNGDDSDGLLGNDNVMSAERVRDDFEEVFKDRDVKAVVFRIDSPGGSAVASETMRRQLLLAKEKSLPVVASIGNVAASGGYWCIAPATKILASELSITGSIGTIGGKIAFKGLLENFGVNVDSMSVGENGSLWSPLTEYSAIQQGFLDKTMDQLYERFVDIVATGRNLDSARVEDVAKGRVWTGAEAKQFNLVDKIGGFKAAIAEAKKLAGVAEGEEVEIVIYPAKKSVFAFLKDSLSGKPAIFSMLKEIKSIYLTTKIALGNEIKLIDTIAN